MAKQKKIRITWTNVGTIIVIILFIYFLHDRYHGKLDIELSYENVFVLPTKSKTPLNNGMLGIGFYDIRIRNLTKQTKTIKEVLLKYTFNDKEYIAKPFRMPLKRISDGESAVEAVTIQNGVDTIIIGDWNNLREKTNKFEPLISEGITDGSAMFILNTCKFRDYKNIKNIELRIIDSTDKVYKKKVVLKENYFDGLKKGFYFDYP